MLSTTAASLSECLFFSDTSPIGELLVTLIFRGGGSGLDLAQTLLRVALAWHNAGRGTPEDPRVNGSFRSLFLSVGQLMRQYFCFWCLQ